MAAADTNVLVRLLVADDPIQTPKAELFLAREKPLWISIVVLLETAWVLGSVYGFTKKQLLAALKGLLSSHDFTLQSPDLIIGALDLYEATKADFADCLALQSAQAEGMLPMGTFDKAAARLPGALGL